jgi:L,D-peptidoglycan transpeptidase YkuD (ErfK/YbiS/YcfS/YnhG family)
MPEFLPLQQNLRAGGASAAARDPTEKNLYTKPAPGSRPAAKGILGMQAIVQPASLESNGKFFLGADIFRCAVGRRGVLEHKQEGDGATPLGVLKLHRVLYRADRLPAPVCVVPVEPIAPDDGWCDDPTHADYNRMIRLPHDARYEELWRSDSVYDIVGVLGWNLSPVVRGQGSAIFLHVARADYAPTEGCIALDLADLRRILAAGLTEILVRP